MVCTKPECNNKTDFVVNVLLFKGSEQISQDHLVAHPPNPFTALKLEIFHSHVLHAAHAKQRAMNLFDVMVDENVDDLGDGERFFAWVRMCATQTLLPGGATLNYSVSFLLFTSPDGLHQELDVIGTF
jgi:hypothetical protein